MLSVSKKNWMELLAGGKIDQQKFVHFICSCDAADFADFAAPRHQLVMISARFEIENTNRVANRPFSQGGYLSKLICHQLIFAKPVGSWNHPTWVLPIALR